MIYTFGHSTMSAEDGAKLLSDHGIGTLIDVRSHPTSKWPQWRIEELRSFEKRFGIEYVWWPQLGGWDERHLPLAEKFECVGVDIPVYAKGKFPKQRIGKDKALCDCEGPSWTNQGLWDYQFFMTLPEFRGALEVLMRFNDPDVHCAIMCCELLWWKCHRSMIADCLAYFKVPTIHLQPKTTPHFNALGNRIERYHTDVTTAWDEWVKGENR